MDIQLSVEELRLIEQLLKGDLSRLILEIAHTDNRAMRTGLMEREELLKGIIAKIEGKLAL
ncbi:hypothetical protein EPN96_00300 [bacterium]|nr:MAG: hypothetical protein EPN96_00300 [bacterium]